MRILITGAAGMLGSDVRSAAIAAGHEPLALSRSELDVTDAPAVAAAIADGRPDAVINCAAWTDVDGAESQPEAAAAINVTGAGNVAQASAAAGAWTIHVSTDYVFPGTQAEPYVESDRVGPASEYGRSKLEGEQAVAAAAPGRHTTVRTAWLFGVAGPCFPQTISRLARERDQLSVVDDQVGCPTWTGHLAPALITLAAGVIAGPVHVAASGSCSWWEFAREIVAGAGIECEVLPCSTAEFPRPAPRPAFSVLRSERGAVVPILPGWRDGLEAYLIQNQELVK
jgi:dTDP-4-dehydrorhamnose reductase